MENLNCFMESCFKLNNAFNEKVKEVTENGWRLYERSDWFDVILDCICDMKIGESRELTVAFLYLSGNFRLYSQVITLNSDTDPLDILNIFLKNIDQGDVPIYLVL